MIARPLQQYRSIGVWQLWCLESPSKETTQRPLETSQSRPPQMTKAMMKFNLRPPSKTHMLGIHRNPSLFTTFPPWASWPYRCHNQSGSSPNDPRSRYAPSPSSPSPQRAQQAVLSWRTSVKPPKRLVFFLVEIWCLDSLCFPPKEALWVPFFDTSGLFTWEPLLIELFHAKGKAGRPAFCCFFNVSGSSCWS